MGRLLTTLVGTCVLAMVLAIPVPLAVVPAKAPLPAEAIALSSRPPPSVWVNQWVNDPKDAVPVDKDGGEKAIKVNKHKMEEENPVNKEQPQEDTFANDALVLGAPPKLNADGSSKSTPPSGLKDKYKSKWEIAVMSLDSGGTRAAKVDPSFMDTNAPNLPELTTGSDAVSGTAKTPVPEFSKPEVQSIAAEEVPKTTAYYAATEEGPSFSDIEKAKAVLEAASKVATSQKALTDLNNPNSNALSMSDFNGPSNFTREYRTFESAGVLNVTIICPTVRRFRKDGSPAPWYLKPMVEKLYRDLIPVDRDSGLVKFLILNSDKEPSKHIEAVELDTINGVQVLQKESYEQILSDQFALSAKSYEDEGYMMEDGRLVAKDTIRWVSAENLDGAYLMEKAMAMSEWVLFLEDDIEPTSGALYKMTQAARALEQNTDMLFLDLYTPHVDWHPGCDNVEHLKPYNFFCCTQAMLFKSSDVGGVADYWKTHATEPVDDNLREYMKMVNLGAYAVRPSIFQHVGAYSSNPDKSTGIVEHTAVEWSP